MLNLGCYPTIHSFSFSVYYLYPIFTFSSPCTRIASRNPIRIAFCTESHLLAHVFPSLPDSVQRLTSYFLPFLRGVVAFALDGILPASDRWPLLGALLCAHASGAHVSLSLRPLLDSVSSHLRLNNHSPHADIPRPGL